MLILRSMSKKC